MYLYLKNFTDNINYIYHQRYESHGVMINKVPKDCQLLIIVDSSTNSVNECREISQFTDIIILDHHQKDIDNPYAIIVNPQLDNYPNKYLSGSGVVFQTCRALDKQFNTKYAFYYVDLVATGNIGDMMRQDVMENRYISRCGLWRIKQTKSGNLGLKELVEETKGTLEINTQDISYYIVPAINAVIRLDDTGKILKLLTSKDILEVKNIVKECCTINEFRKSETKRISKLIKEKNIINDDKVIIINMNNIECQSSLNGLIATKLSRDYQRPCFIGKVKDEIFVGSARGYGDDVYLKTECINSGLFQFAEGHESSFGIRFKIDNIKNIINYFNDKFKDYFNEPSILVDLELNKEELTYDLLKQIDEISYIVGDGYERPVFLIKHITIDKNKSKTIGKKNDHIKLIGSCDDSDLEIMKFNTEENINAYKESDWINVIGNIGLNTWHNFRDNKTIIKRQIISKAIEPIYNF